MAGTATSLFIPISTFGRCVAFKFFTGLRPGESFGLKWSNVDLASGKIVVAESVVGGITSGGVVSPSSGGTGCRG